MKRVAIIGGGVAGLSAAYALEQRRRAGAEVEYTLFESSSRLGGVVLTDRVDGCLIEAGPDSFLTEKPWAADLCRAVGLGDALIGSNDAERKTYILKNGRLVAMPDGLMFMVPTRILPTVGSSLFSVGTKLRMAREWFHPPQKMQGDESVASFVERHYGAEVVDYLADPLLTGVYGGEAAQLGVRAVLPRFAEMEAKHGSLGKAMIAARKNMGGKGPARALFTSMENGMQQMTDAVAATLPAPSVCLNTRVQAVQRQDSGWVVSAGYGSDSFDAVILAMPASVAGALLGASAPQLAAELRGISYSSSVTVALGYGPEVRAGLPAGFGFLVPRRENRRMLAATFVHNKFPHRAPEDRALLRCSLGGTRDEAVLSLPDDEILQIVRGELREILGLAAEPLFARVYKWNGAMAQYGVGHLDRMERVERLRAEVPGLFLAGNGYRGIGVPDCVRTGREAAEGAMGS
jgi:oxygen-dependent protoporphyrinogen oxidase